MLISDEGQRPAGAEGPADSNKDAFVGCGPACVVLRASSSSVLTSSFVSPEPCLRFCVNFLFCEPRALFTFLADHRCPSPETVDALRARFLPHVIL